MALDLDTFLVAWYTIIDDLYQARVAPQLPRGPGKRPALSDSEMLTLALYAQWLHRAAPRHVRRKHSAVRWAAEVRATPVETRLPSLAVGDERPSWDSPFESSHPLRSLEDYI
jgi:hypothetical protein